MTPAPQVLVADRYQLDSDLVARRLDERVRVATGRPAALSAADLEHVALVLLDADVPVETFRAAVAAGVTIGLLHEGRVPRERSSHPAVRLLADRNGPAAELGAAVEKVLAGGTYTPACAPAAGAAPALSPREREVLALVARGLPNRDIAAELAISPHTVRTHVQALLSKLDRANRVAAVAAARQAGLLPR